MQKPKTGQDVAIVTGASHGIGPYIARSLADDGMSLVLTARSSAELDALRAELEAGGTRAVTVAADLTDSKGPSLVWAGARDAFGRVDVLVNNAGGDPIREFGGMSWDQNQAILALNLLAPLHLTHLVLPGMLDRGRGHIVNISSLAGRMGFPYTEAYASAKDGLIAFSRVLRGDYRDRGVSASALVLGVVRGAGQSQRMSDEVGLRVPSLSVPAEVVGRAVVRAVRRDQAEVVVMPGPGRLVKAVMDLFPGFGPWMNHVAGATAALDKVMEQRERSTESADRQPPAPQF
jgi:short-subunit dehydrogenase